MQNESTLVKHNFIPTSLNVEHVTTFGGNSIVPTNGHRRHDEIIPNATVTSSNILKEKNPTFLNPGNFEDGTRAFGGIVNTQ